MAKALFQLFILLFCCAPMMAQPRGIGVMPVGDSWGGVAGTQLAPQLTLMIYQELRKAGLEAALLNPGGEFLPTDLEWAREFGEKAEVEVVLIPSLMPPDKPKSGPWHLKVEFQIISLRGGDARVMQALTDINKHDVEYLDALDPRLFEKQPLGKASRRLAESIAQQLAAAPPIPSGVQAEMSGSCTIEFKVAYREKGTVSKAYDVIIGGREVSRDMKEGVVTHDARAGKLVVQVTLRDAPYKLPAQSIYQASTTLDCGRSARQLALEIGPAGEALLVWR